MTMLWEVTAMISVYVLGVPVCTWETKRQPSRFPADLRS